MAFPRKQERIRLGHSLLVTSRDVVMDGYVRYAYKVLRANQAPVANVKGT